MYENKKRSLPIESLIVLCKFYNVSSDYILGLTDDMESKKRVESAQKSRLRGIKHLLKLLEAEEYMLIFKNRRVAVFLFAATVLTINLISCKIKENNICSLAAERTHHEIHLGRSEDHF